jgi:hypothetical protein
MRRPDADLWYTAAKEEIQAHVDNGTWTLVQLPPGAKAIGSRWIFKIKRNEDGSVERYKGRIVAKGYSQRPGVDFDETYAPTTKWAALRAIFAIAALEDLELDSVDISTAYLNGVLPDHHRVYMQEPEGFEMKDKTWACQLRKGLYGLKQGGRLWYQKLDEVLKGIGFTRTRSDSSVYVWMRGESKVIIPVFVDDLTLASRTKADNARIKDELKKAFKLRDLGPTSFILGVHVTRNRPQRTLQLSQKQYIIDILQRFGFADCHPVVAPMDSGTKLCASPNPLPPADAAAMKDVPYVNAVGALMYLAIATRPDIAYAVGVLCRFNSNPGPSHWLAVKHLFRYLKGTMDLKLTYAPSSDGQLFTSYTDADHGGNPDNGRSTSGYLMKMGTGAISWCSKLQSIVTLSTTEAEFVAAVSAGQEVIWLRSFLSELGYDMTAPSVLNVDNQSAISVAKNPEHHGRMKHLDLRFFWLRDQVEAKVIGLKYLATAEMPADVLTKPLDRLRVQGCRGMMGLYG